MRQKGFTLFELLVAVLLLALISAMIYSVLNVGIRFSEKGEKKLLSVGRELGLADLFHRQIKGGWYDERKKKVVISADEDILRIVTRVPLLYSTAGVVLAVYRYDPGERALYYQEKRDYYLSDYDDEYVPDYEDMFCLMADLDSFLVEYDESSRVVAIELNEREYEFTAWCRKKELSRRD